MHHHGIAPPIPPANGLYQSASILKVVWFYIRDPMLLFLFWYVAKMVPSGFPHLSICTFCCVRVNIIEFTVYTKLCMISHASSQMTVCLLDVTPLPITTSISLCQLVNWLDCGSPSIQTFDSMVLHPWCHLCFCFGISIFCKDGPQRTLYPGSPPLPINLFLLLLKSNPISLKSLYGFTSVFPFMLSCLGMPQRMSPGDCNTHFFFFLQFVLFITCLVSDLLFNFPAAICYIMSPFSLWN